MKKDILIVSFNEHNKIFNEKDCLELRETIINNDPMILVICTQKSRQNLINNHNFQYILKNNLKDKYYLVNKYNLTNIKK